MFFIRLSLILLCFFGFTGIYAAQDEVDTEEWEVVERCLGDLPYPTIPQNQWNFDGIIFSENYEGIRAIRTDFDTSYFIALRSIYTFPFAGQFSPDGRWFAYPIGHLVYGSWYTNTTYFVNALRVVSTDPDHVHHDITWSDWEIGTDYSLNRIIWIDNETFVYSGIPEDIFGYGPIPTHSYGNWVVNAFSGEVEPLPEEYTLPPPNRDSYVNSSLDQQINVVSTNNGVTIQFNDGSTPLIFNTSDSGYLTGFTFSPDKQHAVMSFNQQLYLIDLNEQIIYDLCFMPRFFTGLVWSPDSQYIAFTYDGYPIILNIDTLEMQILRYKTGRIIAWFPIND